MTFCQIKRPSFLLGISLKMQSPFKIINIKTVMQFMKLQYFITYLDNMLIQNLDYSVFHSNLPVFK